MQTHFLNYCINLCTGWGNTSWCNKHPINFNVLTTQPSVFHLHSGWVYLIGRQPSTRWLRDPASFYLLALLHVISKVISFICIQPAQKEGSRRIIPWEVFLSIHIQFPRTQWPHPAAKEAEKCSLAATEEEEMGLGTDSQAVSI